MPGLIANSSVAVIASDPRRPCAENKRIVVPGFDGLRSFSQVHEKLLKAKLRRGVGILFFAKPLAYDFQGLRPVSGKNGGKTETLNPDTRPVVGASVPVSAHHDQSWHHAVPLHRNAGSKIEFTAYDPKSPEHPVKLVYEKSHRAFTFPPSIYWGGGVLSVMEIYAGFPY